MYKKRTTLKDIAREAGVSSTTVSIVLNDRKDVQIGVEAKGKVLKAAEKLGYEFTPSKKRKKEHVICFVHSEIEKMNMTTSFFARVSSQLRTLCEAAGMIVQESEYHQKKGLPAYQSVLANQPSALVSFNDKFTEIHLSQNNKIPLFSLQGERNDPSIKMKHSLFLVDDTLVGELAAQHLLDKGYKSAAMIFPELKGRCIHERSAGFRSVFERGAARIKHIEFPYTAHIEIEKWFRSADCSDFDSFYFFSDAMAIPAIRGLLSQGIKIPENAAILGTDNLYWGQYCYPSLTTMNLHEENFAGKIFREIQSLLTDGVFYPGETIIPVDLIKREST